MKLCLVNPPISMKQRYGALSHAGSRLPPLNVALLAAEAREAGHAVCLLDAEAEGWSQEATAMRIWQEKPQVVGVTATTTSMMSAGRLIARLKAHQPDLLTVVGGVHVSSCGEETLQRFPALDACVVGEGDETLLELLQAVAGGDRADLALVRGLLIRRGKEVVFTGHRGYLSAEALEKLPFPAWDLLPDLPRTYRPALHSFRHLPCTSLITSRGCPARCTFCDRTVSGSRVRGYSATYVHAMVSHLVSRYGVREIIFHDDNFVTMSSRLEQFCELLLDKGPRLAWSCTARVDMLNLELLKLMRQAGCWQVAYGVESGSQAVLDTIHKGITLDQTRQTLAWTREAGLEARGYFIIGVPGETRESLEATHRFLLEVPLSDFQMSIFAPHPGTELYEQLVAEGQFKPDWEKDGGWLVTWVPPGLQAEDLLETQRRCMRDFYFRPSTLARYGRRFLGSPEAWGPLLASAAQLALYRG